MVEMWARDGITVPKAVETARLHPSETDLALLGQHPDSQQRFAEEAAEIHAAENRGEDRLHAIDVFSPPRLDPNWLD